MKRLFFIILMNILFTIGAEIRINAAAPNWIAPKDMQYTMTIHAKIQTDDGQFIEADGSLLAGFKNGKCRGVKTVQSGPSGKWFQLTVASNEIGETGMVLKVYNSAKDQVACIQKKFDFTANAIIGLINTPENYTAETCSESGAILKFNPGIIYLNEVTKTFDINVIIENVTDLGAFQFDINYNPDIVGIEKESHVVLGSFLESTGRTAEQFIRIADSEKPLVVAITSGENAGPNGIGILEKITFTVKSFPESESILAINEAQLTNASGPPFTVLPIDEIIDVLIIPVPTPTYIIKAAINGHGNIIPSGDITVTEGGGQLFTLSPDNCYNIKDVRIDSQSAGILTSYLFSSVNKNHTIEGIFSIKTYMIEAGSGDKGTVSPSDIVTAECGTRHTFTITPDACYKIEDIKADNQSVMDKVRLDGDVGYYTFENISANHKIEATFAIKTYTIQAVSGDNGMILPSDIVTAECGTEHTFAVTPDACHKIEDVKADNQSVIEKIELNGGVGYYTFENVRANHTINATFAENSSVCTIESWVSGDGGSINPSGTMTAECGSDKTFSINPDEFFYILDVKVDGLSVGAAKSYTFECDEGGNHTIEAVFTSCACIIESGKGISPSGIMTMNCGSVQPFIITPDNCYDIKNVLIDGESKGNVDSYIFKCDESGTHKIEALFDLKTCTIETMAGEGGTIEPSGKITALCGNGQEFIINPDECHETETVIVDEKSKGIINSYAFNCDETGNHKINASFNLKVMPGDINQDGNVDLQDAVLSLRILVGMIAQFSGMNKEHDISGDGKISIEEAVYILHKLQTDSSENVNLRDVILILKLLSGIDINKEKITVCAEINGDKKIGIEEVIYTLQVVAGVL